MLEWIPVKLVDKVVCIQVWTEALQFISKLEQIYSREIGSCWKYHATVNIQYHIKLWDIFFLQSTVTISFFRINELSNNLSMKYWKVNYAMLLVRELLLKLPSPEVYYV